MLLTVTFPIRSTSLASRGLLRPRVQHHNATREPSEKLPHCANAKRGANACGVRGRTEHHERVNDDREREPQGPEADRLHKRRKGGLTSTPRQ